MDLGIVKISEMRREMASNMRRHFDRIRVRMYRFGVRLAGDIIEPGIVDLNLELEFLGEKFASKLNPEKRYRLILEEIDES
jgi:hypothetical protein